MKESGKLSDHLPTAIRQAVEDFEKCRKDSKYVIDFSFWYSEDVTNPGKCMVCLAGSVIANRYYEELEEYRSRQGCLDVVYPDYIMDDLDASRIEAFDALVRGNVSKILAAFGWTVKPWHVEHHAPTAPTKFAFMNGDHEDKEGYEKYLDAVVEYLKETASWVERCCYAKT